MPLPSEDPLVLVSEEGFGTPGLTPKCASWLLSRMFLMGLDSYTPGIYCVLSMDTPLSGHASPVLDGVLVDSPSRMGSKLRSCPLSAHKACCSYLSQEGLAKYGVVGIFDA
ncbi:hypothetical protein DSO57_1030144, partial [Entomophthora muscae]